jgi:peptidoglycan/LPS O-acetylase OafA/YrhL
VTRAKPSVARAKSRFVGLDVLRLLAVALVLGRHTWQPPESWPGTLRWVLTVWKRGGWVGVDLFFVLSGFLVSGLLFAEYKLRGSFSIGRFYMRRGWKIYPPFFTLIAATVVSYLASGSPIPLPRLASELAFLQSYLPGLWNHTWSLAVEEHFYLTLPLVLAVVAKSNQRSPAPLKPVLAIVACVALGAFLLRLANWHYRPAYFHMTHLFASHLRMDSLAFGVAISYLYHFYTTRFREWMTPWRHVLILGGASLLIPAFAFRLEGTPFIYTLGLSVFYLGSGMLLVGVLLSSLPRSRAIGLLGMLGAQSYSIYLWHMPVRVWGIAIVERTRGVELGLGAKFALYFLGSLVVGVIMARVIEGPALDLRDRWFPALAGSPVQGHSDAETEPSPTR